MFLLTIQPSLGASAHNFTKFRWSFGTGLQRAGLTKAFRVDVRRLEGAQTL